jgi:outer membrane protein TolC
VLEKQIELAGNKLDIAKYRLDDGQISRTEYLESYIFFLEARMKYLGELKNYLVDKLDLEGKFIG